MENPEKIEIEGLKTIHKLCKFGADHNMEGCTFTEIVERMFDELQATKAQAVPEGFVFELEKDRFVSFPLKDLLFTALENSKKLKTKPNWVHVRDILAVGSTVATRICLDLGVNPDGTKFELIEAQEPAND